MKLTAVFAILLIRFFSCTFFNIDTSNIRDCLKQQIINPYMKIEIIIPSTSKTNFPLENAAIICAKKPINKAHPIGIKMFFKVVRKEKL